MAKKRELPPPTMPVLLICDQVIRDGSPAGKPSLIGVFNGIYASEFPAVHPRMTLFFQLTNGHGKVKLTLRMVDVGDAEKDIHGPLEFEVEFSDARQTIESQVQVLGVTIPRPGEYRVQIYAGNVLLGERKFVGSLITPKN